MLKTTEKTATSHTMGVNLPETQFPKGLKLPKGNEEGQ